MQPAFFVDTWFLIASVDRFDAHHVRVRRLAPSLEGATLVTHDAVLAEVLAFFSAQGSGLRREAAEAVRRALRRLEVVHTSGRLFNAGLDLYERRPDEAYSLADCMSMQLMWDRGITHVLTNDHHFTQEKFTVVSE